MKKEKLLKDRILVLELKVAQLEKLHEKIKLLEYKEKGNRKAFDLLYNRIEYKFKKSLK